MTDITREKAYEQTLEESTQRLRDFLSVASHDSAPPHHHHQGYAQLMSGAMGEMPEEKARAIFESIERNIDHLYRLGDELLDVSRIEEERFTLRRRVVDPVRLVREVVEEMRARGYGGDLKVDIDPGLGKIKVDRDKIKRLLIILLENAFKHSPEPFEVEVKVGREGGGGFEVLDRGPGCPREKEKRIFERFYQVDDVFITQARRRPGPLHRPGDRHRPRRQDLVRATPGRGVGLPLPPAAEIKGLAKSPKPALPIR